MLSQEKGVLPMLSSTELKDRGRKTTSEEFGPEEIASANGFLQGKTPQTILSWAVTTFHPRLTMATAFGAEGCCIMHMLADIEPSVRIFNLETGYQFPETLALRERIRQRYGIAVEFIQPEMTVA